MTIDFAKARETMVEQQVRPWEVFQPRVLEAIGGRVYKTYRLYERSVG